MALELFPLDFLVLGLGVLGLDLDEPLPEILRSLPERLLLLLPLPGDFISFSSFCLPSDLLELSIVLVFQYSILCETKKCDRRLRFFVSSFLISF